MEAGLEKGKHAVGALGEDAACRYLESLGHTILARNWRSSHLELDIVTADPDGHLRFVEVKTRVEPIAATPEEQVNRTKRRRIEQAALAYLNEPAAPKPVVGSGESFFDIVAVTLGENRQRIVYFPAAWIPMYV